jgi:hypothetical protein
MKYILFGLFMGVALGMAVANVIDGQRRDSCQARVSSEHFSLCLDSKFQKAKELFR